MLEKRCATRDQEQEKILKLAKPNTEVTQRSESGDVWGVFNQTEIVLLPFRECACPTSTESPAIIWKYLKRSTFWKYLPSALLWTSGRNSNLHTADDSVANATDHPSDNAYAAGGRSDTCPGRAVGVSRGQDDDLMSFSGRQTRKGTKSNNNWKFWRVLENFGLDREVSFSCTWHGRSLLSLRSDAEILNVRCPAGAGDDSNGCCGAISNVCAGRRSYWTGRN